MAAFAGRAGQLLLTMLLVGMPALGWSNAAKAQQPSAITAVPFDPVLDPLLSSKNYLALGNELPKVPIEKRMAWLRARILTGGTAFLVWPYVRDLWQVGQLNNSTDPNQDLRIVAALFMLYAYQLIVIDGAKCEDNTAPERRMSQLLEGYGPVLKHLKPQPVPVRGEVVIMAIKLEQSTAATRKDDDFLCRDGMAQIKAGLDAGAKPKEVPTPPGKTGKSMVVATPSNYVPKLLPPEKYLPVQQQMRSSIQAALVKLVE